MVLQHLETFCRVVEEGSFTKAADGLGFSQPTVTKQIKSLEEDLGARLLTRAQRRLQLTPAGEIVYDYARQIINAVRECRSALEGIDSPGQGDLRIGAVFTIALFTLPPVLEEFRRSHPRVTVHVRTGTNQSILGMVLHNEVDIGLTAFPLTHPQIRTTPLFEDPVLLVASPGTEWARKRTLTPTEMSAIPMVSYQRMSQFRGFVDANFEAAGIRPNVVMEFDTHEMVKTMVQLGLGVAMIPKSAVEEDLAQGKLVTLQIAGFPKLTRVTAMLVREGRMETWAMKAFADLIRKARAAGDDEAAAPGPQSVRAAEGTASRKA